MKEKNDLMDKVISLDIRRAAHNQNRLSGEPRLFAFVLR